MIFSPVQAEEPVERPSIKQRLILIWFGIRFFVTKRKKFFISVAVFFFILTAGFFFTWNARPGEFLFFPRLLVEKAILPVNTDSPATNFTNAISLLRHRVTSYKALSDQGECVKLLLAEPEVTTALKLSLSKITEDQESIMLGSIYSILLQLNQISKSDCQKSPLVGNYSWLISMKLAQQPGGEEFVKKELTTHSTALRQQHNATKLALQSAKITTQSVLNQVNELLLYTNQLIATAEAGNVSNGYDMLTKLHSVSFSLSRVTDLIKGEAKPEFVPWQFEIISICKLQADAENCSEASLAGNWNSIASQVVEVKRMSLAEDIFKGYFTLL